MSINPVDESVWKDRGGHEDEDEDEGDVCHHGMNFAEPCWQCEEEEAEREFERRPSHEQMSTEAGDK